jgi:hypothetical protein
MPSNSRTVSGKDKKNAARRLKKKQIEQENLQTLIKLDVIPSYNRNKKQYDTIDTT